MTGDYPPSPDCPAPSVPLGLKLDSQKNRWDLLPFGALESVVRVLTFGAAKYSAGNWRHVDDWQSRYFAAALRHLVAYEQGEVTDPESGLPHLAHAICCALFMLDLSKGKR